MVIACDQRGGIRKLLADNPAGQKYITDQMLGDTKSDVVCSVPRMVEEASLARDVALLIGLDASGHDSDVAGHHLSRPVPGINGASGVIARRSFWKDCVSLDREQQKRLL